MSIVWDDIFDLDRWIRVGAWWAEASLAKLLVLPACLVTKYSTVKVHRLAECMCSGRWQLSWWNLTLNHQPVESWENKMIVFCGVKQRDMVAAEPTGASEPERIVKVLLWCDHHCIKAASTLGSQQVPHSQLTVRQSYSIHPPSPFQASKTPFLFSWHSFVLSNLLNFGSAKDMQTF